MISHLYLWSLKSTSASSAGISSRMKGCFSAMISRMRASIAVEVLGGEGAAVGQLEVVVEAVLDRRADGERGPGEQVEHRLGEHVGRRVADRVQAPLVGLGDDRGLVAVGERPHQVALGAVDVGDDRGLGQPGADRRRQITRSGAGGELTLGSVGQGDGDLVGHAGERTRCPRPLLKPVPGETAREMPARACGSRAASWESDDRLAHQEDAEQGGGARPRPRPGRPPRRSPRPRRACRGRRRAGPGPRRAPWRCRRRPGASVAASQVSRRAAAVGMIESFHSHESR